MPIISRRPVRLRRRRISFLFTAFLVGTILFWTLRALLSTRKDDNQKVLMEETKVEVPKANLNGSRPRIPHEKRAFASTTWSNHSISITSHVFHSSGLLELNKRALESQEHPIRILIKRSQQAWAEKLHRQSTTLLQAVNEYRKRHNDREPPLGFNIWWAYVKRNNVQLVDEYDQIWRDIEVIWGFGTDALNQSQQAFLENHAGDVYVLEKKSWNSPLEVSLGASKKMTLGGRLVVEMLRDAGVDAFIPPFKVIVNPDDRPIVQKDWALWNRAVNSARTGRVLLPSKRAGPRAPYGWRLSCDPLSPAWTTHVDYAPHEKPPFRDQPRTFIHDNARTMDPCQHPHLFRMHGQFLSFDHGRGPHLQQYDSDATESWVGVISFSPSRLHADLTAAIPLEWVQDSDLEDDEAVQRRHSHLVSHRSSHSRRWSLKSSDLRLHWRGTNTGMWHGDGMEWELGQRLRMMDMLQVNSDRAGKHTFPEPFVFPENLTILVEGEGEKVVSREQWTNAMMDVAFAGQPTSCSTEQGICDELWERYEWRRGVEREGVGRKRKFLLDVDGNAWSSRFKRLVSSGSVVFKSTIYPEWFMDRIQPWVHYVPVQVDLVDLWDAYAFLREGKNDELARGIGGNAYEWSRKFWRREDMVAYNFRLFLEYARAMSNERESMDYVYDPQDEV
ncbi:glycosyltransferase family 90 protein [Moniliophthora roreri MCA 2997]|uniref:Glycosyltransferase family 90 protein n=1 Tax=Moniliophthora roreri (strain MCA 2997) TaxID=1381753 RepID=V2XW32_MONRO|nr:glycosyltransferase family 90 protein [Moniliophthora roreri MCA 2997]